MTLLGKSLKTDKYKSKDPEVHFHYLHSAGTYENLRIENLRTPKSGSVHALIILLSLRWTSGSLDLLTIKYPLRKIFFWSSFQ